MAPLPGEALDSWIAAYARRLRTTTNDLITHLGLGGTRINQMTLRLHEHEAASLEQMTGVDRQVLPAMTLAPYDGLAIAIHPARRALLARFPAGRFSGASARYCPAWNETRAAARSPGGCPGRSPARCTRCCWRTSAPLAIVLRGCGTRGAWARGQAVLARVTT